MSLRPGLDTGDVPCQRQGFWELRCLVFSMLPDLTCEMALLSQVEMGNTVPFIFLNIKLPCPSLSLP